MSSGHVCMRARAADAGISGTVPEIVRVQKEYIVMTSATHRWKGALN
jgi:hypothetical protein